MNPNDIDLTQVSRIYRIANTPLFLVRKLKDDPAVRAIADNCSVEEILDALRFSMTTEPTSGIESVRPYALLVALWFKPEISGLQEAAGTPAPYFNWYAYIAATLMQTFSPVQTQSIRAPGLLLVPGVTEWSRRQGSARAAMSFILQKCKGTTRIDLVTHPENESALQLYISLGFKVESGEENYFGDGEPRLVLSLTRPRL